ncbi:NADH-quinone oxidoreductase subunit D [Candidatus Marinimicrobia bacterium MT.SAG.3]|nr:NADH-quinone oxidoreductase subunit D [Candidatus Marinimicrobia bacterium MT.SAG.3]TFB13319.1 NADH-quinone oxidoreductase subunit D [Candidatus Marinimicrobia bacterium MT.SAG.4]
MVRVEKDLQGETLELSFGPQHPATHGTLQIVMELDGEVVLNVEPHIGFLHTGFEKLAEHMSYNQFVTVTDRMNYLSPLSNNIGFSLAAEKLFRIEIPKRGQYIRVLMAELSRIGDHLVAVGTAAMDLGAMTVFLYGFREREKLYDLFEWATGARLTTSYTRVGGLMADLPDDFPDAVTKWVEQFPKTIDEIEKLLSHNRIFQDRTYDIGVISKEDVLKYSLTGPVARASGINYDLRKDMPYSSYEDFEFEVPIGENGDAYDRYLVRMEEMRQSVGIVKQVLANLPDGEVNIDPDSKITLPGKDEVYTTIEGLIHHFEVTMENKGILPPVAEVYMGTESPNGELGFYIVSNGEREPYRVRIRPPSFINYTIFKKLMKGAMFSDVVSNLGSLNIIAGELDR